MKVGDTVRIKEGGAVKSLKKQGLLPIGTIVKIDGGYYYVRPRGAVKENIFELYWGEIELDR